MAQKLLEEVREKERKQEFRERIETLRQQYCETEDFTPLYHQLKFIIKNKAKGYHNKYRFLKLEESDFENELWLVAIQLAKERQNVGDLYYYDILTHRMEDRVKNLIKEYMAVKRKGQNFAVPLNEEEPDKGQFENKSNNFLGTGKRRQPMVSREQIYEVEVTAINRVFVQQMINDKALNDREREILRYIYNNPDATQTEIAKHFGMKHNEQLRRALKRIRKKLAAYEEVAFS